MRAKKASKAELIKRREEIRRLILQGTEKTSIIEEMAKKHDTSTRAIREDIRIIGKKWESAEPELVKKSKNKYLERLEMLLHKALQEDKLKVALDIQKEINKISGLYQEKEKDAEEVRPTIIKVGKKPTLKAVENGD